MNDRNDIESNFVDLTHVPSSPNDEAASSSSTSFSSDTSTPKASLLSMPNEVLLQIADYFIDDYYFWKQTRLKYLRRMGAAEKFCPYLCLANTHPYLYALLLGNSCPSNIKIWNERRERDLRISKRRRKSPPTADCLMLNEDFAKWDNVTASPCAPRRKRPRAE